MKIIFDNQGGAHMDPDALLTFQNLRTKEKQLIEAMAEGLAEYNNSFDECKIKEVIFNGPATVVFWKDGTKTVVKCMDGDHFDYETGIAMCMLKRIYGKSYSDFKKYLKEVVEKEAKKNEKKAGHDKAETASSSNANN